MKTNKKSLLLGIFLWVCFIFIHIALNGVSYLSTMVAGVVLSMSLILCLIMLLPGKYRDGREIPLNRRIELCVSMLWTTGLVGLIALPGFFFLERYEKVRSREGKLVTYSPRLVTVRTAFEGQDSIELQILVSSEYQSFDLGEKVELCRTFWSGDNSLHKVTRDMFVSPSVSRGIDNIWISRWCNEEYSSLEEISISEIAAYRAYRYTASKPAVVIHDPKSD